MLVLYRGKLIAIELKSRRGQCSRSQRTAREALLRAGAEWWVCRSANAAMWALAQSGVHGPRVGVGSWVGGSGLRLVLARLVPVPPSTHCSARPLGRRSIQTRTPTVSREFLILA